MLKDCVLKHIYSSGYDEPKEFFTEALIESTLFDLGLGFFSSSGIRSLAHGFAIFIANGGRMRAVINHVLSVDDKEAIEKGQQRMVEVFTKKTITNIDHLVATLSRSDEQFFRCFSYLISVNRIEFVATISTKGGLGHDKYGIFTDSQGNKVAFTGSANFSRTALDTNGETITVFSSWEDMDRVVEYQNLFDLSWQHDTPHLIHIPIDEVKTHIEGIFPPETLMELIQHGIDLRDIETSPESDIVQFKPLSPRLLEKLIKKEQEPRFPFPEEREIQKDAYNAWVANGKKGIFAMATGSGKTVTALNCVLKRYQAEGFYKILIVVPTRALVAQWEREVKVFNFQNIISTQTDKDWKKILSRYITRSIQDPKKNLVLITTYATFKRNDLQKFLKDTRGPDTFTYIADEVHNVGSAQTLRYLPTMITQRIGLSATPERIYDDIGSDQLYRFFSSYPPKYTYRYTMKQAIEDDILCHYDYFPIFVELTEEEMKEYKHLTDRLRKYINPETGKYGKEAEMLLLKRKRVVHKAENKKSAIAKLLDELNNQNRLDYTFVFVPEGYEPDYTTIDSYTIKEEDVHIIDEYAQMFKERGYSYHKYVSELDDAHNVLQNFANGDIKILLSMKCLDEGVDIPRAEHAIFCSSTGNPRQFIQRRGRVLRKSKEKEKATIWDLIVMPPEFIDSVSSTERNMLIGEVKRIVNFAALADNQVDILLYGELKILCGKFDIKLFDILDEENQKYN
jgi:superfamily II DNA or RNA helicase